MDAIQTESKIDATHRLRKSSQWHEATEFRDAERLRFRGEGMTRAEAADASWTSMIEEFPPLEEEVAWLSEMANFSPLNCATPAPGEYGVDDVWYVLHKFYAAQSFYRRYQYIGASKCLTAVINALEKLSDEAPNEVMRGLFLILNNDYQQFLAIAERTFDAERLHRESLETNEANTDVASLMGKMSEGMSDLSQQYEAAVRLEYNHGRIKHPQVASHP